MNFSTVYKSNGNWYLLKNEQGGFIQARLKGKLKLDDITSTNPVAVGDKVMIEYDTAEKDYLITTIADRTNYINRVSPKNRNKQHIIAANMDQLVILMSFKQPRTSIGFVDRLLVTSELYHIKPVILINKTDLYTETDWASVQEFKQRYHALGYEVHTLSLKDGVDEEVLKNIFTNKISLLAGHSGVGKSTLLNKLITTTQQKTNIVSNYSGKGMHTTTFVEMFDLPAGGSIIDSPGIKELEMIHIQPHELAGYFPELRNLQDACKFSNCQHIAEPNCAVQSALEAGSISQERYKSYVNMRASL